MTIRYKCEECGAALNINDELAGTEGSCPRCHVEFVVPSADAVAAKAAKADKPRSSGALNTEDDIGDFLSSDEIPVASGTTSLAESDSADSDADDNPFDDETPSSRKKSVVDDDRDSEEDEELEDRTKRKKGQTKDAGQGPKRAKADPASVAKSLMGKGAPVVEEEPEPGAKRKRRQFGAGSDRPAGEITSTKEMVAYFAKIGWPGVVGTLLIAAISGWVYTRMQKTLDLPPLAPVSGTVTIDGKPVASGTIVQFLPMEAAKNPKLGSSTGFTGADGKYTLNYTNDHAGAVIGKHYVLITASDPTQGIPARYSTTFGGVEAEVTKEGKPINFDLKSDPPPDQ
ncbi:MAG TPA: hypothetical protein VGM05_21825 [Planctomycetaceae bacterium]|jgi:DNA-directed RNA polymerase subunit RPC12/RpoP